MHSIRNTAEAAKSDLRVIGIDDWAWRMGQRYGTLICDLERHRVVDLLPDRDPATVEAWLRARPGIEVVARDRNGGYRGAVARAFPRRALVVAEQASGSVGDIRCSIHRLEPCDARFPSGPLVSCARRLKKR